MRTATALAVTITFLLAACSDRDPVADEANEGVAALPASDEPTANAEGAPPVTASGQPEQTRPPAPQGAADAIPKLLQGRWALSPEDCTSTRGDAKGLLIISANDLRFYESRAVPTARMTRAADSISGDFRFTGEGQSWTMFEALERRPEGLVRTERNPNASFTYARCD